MLTQTCRGPCGRTMEATTVNFTVNNARKIGLNSRCKVCIKEASRLFYLRYAGKISSRINEYNKKRRAPLDEIKQSLGCKKCGEREPRCLDFHHVNPKEKKGVVGRMVVSGHPWASVLAEVKKCEVLCANCHRKEHRARRTNKPKRKKIWVDLVKLRNKCAACGEGSCPDMLDLHHLDPSTKIKDVSRLLQKTNWPRLVAEVRKCVVLCANCHRLLHAGHFKMRREDLVVVEDV